MKKDFFTGAFRTVLALLVCSLSQIVGVILAGNISNTGIWGKVRIVFAVIICVSGTILSGLILKNYGDNKMNYLVAFSSTFFVCLIVFVLISLNYSSDTVGYLIVYMNSPGFLLTNYLSSKNTDISNEASCIIIAASPMVSMIFASIGLMIKKIYGDKHNIDVTENTIDNKA